MNRRVEIKAEQIARMVVQGVKGPRIAIEMGMSYFGLQRILAQPEYLAIEEQVRAMVLDKMDARLQARASMVEEVEDAVPEAMKILLEQMRKKRDLKAALEVLDRDPQKQFVKGKPAAAEAPPPGVASLPHDVLQQAMADADITHKILKQQPPLSPSKTEA